MPSTLRMVLLSSTANSFLAKAAPPIASLLPTAEAGRYLHSLGSEAQGNLIDLHDTSQESGETLPAARPRGDTEPPRRVCARRRTFRHKVVPAKSRSTQ